MKKLIKDKHIRIGFSPCPNDTFIFDALINKKIDTGGYVFEAVMEDVETLNKWAIEEKLPVTKLSYAVLPLVLNKYAVLNSGSALGSGVGPLLIRKNVELPKIDQCLIAIPGEHTTAHLLFSMAYPSAKQKVFLRYDEIEQFVIDGKGLGVIIHENRFTYKDKGLSSIIDLGEYWEQETGIAIPLGGIVINKSLPADVQMEIDSLIKKSIEYSFSNYPVLSDFVKEHAREMNEDIMRKHIDLYVNDYSIDLGKEGKKAVKKIVAVFNKMHGNELSPGPDFVSQ